MPLARKKRSYTKLLMGTTHQLLRKIINGYFWKISANNNCFRKCFTIKHCLKIFSIIFDDVNYKINYNFFYLIFLLLMFFLFVFESFTGIVTAAVALGAFALLFYRKKNNNDLTLEERLEAQGRSLVTTDNTVINTNPPLSPTSFLTTKQTNLIPETSSVIPEPMLPPLCPTNFGTLVQLILTVSQIIQNPQAIQTAQLVAPQVVQTATVMPTVTGFCANILLTSYLNFPPQIYTKILVRNNIFQLFHAPKIRCEREVQKLQEALNKVFQCKLTTHREALFFVTKLTPQVQKEFLKQYPALSTIVNRINLNQMPFFDNIGKLSTLQDLALILGYLTLSQQEEWILSDEVGEFFLGLDQENQADFLCCLEESVFITFANKYPEIVETLNNNPALFTQLDDT